MKDANEKQVHKEISNVDHIEMLRESISLAKTQFEILGEILYAENITDEERIVKLKMQFSKGQLNIRKDHLEDVRRESFGVYDYNEPSLYKQNLNDLKLKCKKCNSENLEYYMGAVGCIDCLNYYIYGDNRKLEDFFIDIS